MRVPPYNRKVLIRKNSFRQFNNNQRKDSLRSSSRLRWAQADLGQPRRNKLS